MTLLTICTKLAENVGLKAPDAVMTSPAREWAEAVVMSNATGEELARRVDFGALNVSTTLTASTADEEYDLGDAFSRIIPGIGVTYGAGIVRPLTQAEWSSMTPTEGAPRYFMLEGNKIRLWPYLSTGESVTVSYQTKNWCDNGTAEWNADTDASLIDESLMVKGLIARWRRQKGMPYQDYEAEFEADLADLAQFDDRSRF